MDNSRQGGVFSTGKRTYVGCRGAKSDGSKSGRILGGWRVDKRPDPPLEIEKVEFLESEKKISQGQAANGLPPPRSIHIDSTWLATAKRHPYLNRAHVAAIGVGRHAGAVGSLAHVGVKEIFEPRNPVLIRSAVAVVGTDFNGPGVALARTTIGATQKKMR